MKFSDIPRNPDSKTLRQFAAIWVIFFGAIGCWHLNKGGEHGWYWIALAIAAGVPGLIWPKLLKPIFVTWMILAFPIGWVVSHIILASIFYLVFTPLGLILRATGHDALKRKKTTTNSYWEPRTQQKNMGRYLKQF